MVSIKLAMFGNVSDENLTSYAKNGTSKGNVVTGVAVGGAWPHPVFLNNKRRGADAKQISLN